MAHAGSKYTVQAAFAGEERPPYQLLGIDRQYYSCFESREMKYCEERSDRFELASIEQAKDE